MQPPIDSQFLESTLQPSSRDLTKNIGVQGFGVPPLPQKTYQKTLSATTILQ